MEYCDLHCHSGYSDGTCTPAEIVDLACQAGLRAIALTDHNTIDGIEAFTEAAKGRIETLAGCEFTTVDGRQELHLLGFFRHAEKQESIRETLAQQVAWKEESNRITIERLAAAGYALSYEEFLAFAGDGIRNRVHIARYLMDKGIVSGIKEAFWGLLSPDGPYYKASRKLDFYQTIALISEAGGVSVWAHPLYHVDRTTCERILEKGKRCGLDGVEVLYSTYTEEDTAFMMEISEKYGLLKSGGSDFHGENKPDIRIGTGRGNLRIPYDYFTNIKSRLYAERNE